MNAPEIYELHTAHCSQLQNGGAVSFGVSVKALATFVGERLSSASAQKKRSKCEAAGLRAEETHIPSGHCACVSVCHAVLPGGACADHEKAPGLEGVWCAGDGEAWILRMGLSQRV